MKQQTPQLAMTIKDPAQEHDPRFCAGHGPHEMRLSKLERVVEFIAEKTGVHFNMDEFHAKEAKRPDGE